MNDLNENRSFDPAAPTQSYPTEEYPPLNLPVQQTPVIPQSQPIAQAPFAPQRSAAPAPAPVQPIKRKNKKPLLIALAVTAAVCVIAAIFLIVFLPNILNGERYAQAKELMNSGKYMEAGDLFSAMGGYRNANLLMQECYYNEATQLIASDKTEDVNQAIELMEKIPDYDGSKEKLKEAKYQYIQLNFNNDDEQTYQYVCELKESGFRDIDSIYIRLYQWRVEAYWNSSPDDKETDVDTISKYDPVYCHIHLEGGFPSDCVTLYFEYTMPSGNSGKDYKDGLVRNGWTDFYWSEGLYSDPQYGTTGILRAKVYDEDHNLLYSGSVRITD